MTEIVERIHTIHARILGVCGLVAGIVTFLVMILIVANALMRKIFNRPLEGTLEITEAALPLMIFLAIAYTQLNKGHIRVVLLTRHFPDAVQKTLLVVAMLAGCLFFVWATWASWGFAMESFEISETAWGAIRFPIWPVKFALTAGLAMLAFQFLIDAARALLRDHGADGKRA